MPLESNPIGSPKDNFFKPNYNNAQIITAYPQVDEIYIFPSKALHSTAINNTETKSSLPNDSSSSSNDLDDEIPF